MPLRPIVKTRSHRNDYDCENTVCRNSCQTLGWMDFAPVTRIKMPGQFAEGHIEKAACRFIVALSLAI
jgi:hypothetical protein